MITNIVFNDRDHGVRVSQIPPFVLTIMQMSVAVGGVYAVTGCLTEIFKCKGRVIRGSVVAALSRFGKD